MPPPADRRRARQSRHERARVGRGPARLATVDAPTRRPRSYRWCSCDPHADVGQLGIEIERMPPTLATNAGELGTAKRRTQVAHEPGVYPDDAGFDLLGNAMAACE